MEIRRNIVPPQAHNVGNLTNQPKVGEPEEMQAGETTINTDVDVLKAIRTTHTQCCDGSWHHGKSSDDGDSKYFTIDVYEYLDGRIVTVYTHQDEDGYIWSEYETTYS